MKVKFTTVGWLAFAGFVFLLIVTGVWAKVLIGAIVIKTISYCFNAGTPSDNSDKAKKGKAKLPAPLAHKLAQRNEPTGKG
jgi:hypothetical protein